LDRIGIETNIYKYCKSSAGADSNLTAQGAAATYNEKRII
jgi:hypothetical protein